VRRDVERGFAGPEHVVAGAAGSRIAVLVVPTDEERVMAEEARAILQGYEAGL